MSRIRASVLPARFHARKSSSLSSLLPLLVLFCMVPVPAYAGAGAVAGLGLFFGLLFLGAIVAIGLMFVDMRKLLPRRLVSPGRRPFPSRNSAHHKRYLRAKRDSWIAQGAVAAATPAGRALGVPRLRTQGQFAV